MFELLMHARYLVIEPPAVGGKGAFLVLCRNLEERYASAVGKTYTSIYRYDQTLLIF